MKDIVFTGMEIVSVRIIEPHDSQLMSNDVHYYFIDVVKIDGKNKLPGEAEFHEAGHLLSNPNDSFARVLMMIPKEQGSLN